MKELTYGFVNNDNILIATAVCMEDDFNTLNRIKNEYNATAYYKMNLEKELAELNVAYWTGSRFCPPSPYPSWVFDEELNTWKTPTPYPEDGKEYIWDENTTSWILFSLPN